VKVIEKNNEKAKDDKLYRNSGRSSLRQSQSIASEDHNAGNSHEEYEKDSFVVDEEESQHLKKGNKKKDNKHNKSDKKSDELQDMEDTATDQAKTKIDPVEHRESNPN
jgi:hypothetical protein